MRASRRAAAVDASSDPLTPRVGRRSHATGWGSSPPAAPDTASAMTISVVALPMSTPAIST